MVDAQFKDDRFKEDASRDARAQDTAQERKSARAQQGPRKLTATQRLNARTQAMRMAALQAADSDEIVLEHMTAALTDAAKQMLIDEGEEPVIKVRVRRISPQDLVAGDLLPTNARAIANHFMQEGMRATAGERARVSLEDTSFQQAAEDVFGDDHVASADAALGLINAICIAAVDDDNLHLYWTNREAAGDPVGMAVARLPEEDRYEIANWAFRQEEVAAQSVEPFRARPQGGDTNVPAMEAGHGQTERADQV